MRILRRLRRAISGCSTRRRTSLSRRFTIGALYGLAAVAECRGELDAAKGLYERIETLATQRSFERHTKLAAALDCIAEGSRDACAGAGCCECAEAAGYDAQAASCSARSRLQHRRTRRHLKRPRPRTPTEQPQTPATTPVTTPPTTPPADPGQPK